MKLNFFITTLSNIISKITDNNEQHKTIMIVFSDTSHNSIDVLLTAKKNEA